MILRLSDGSEHACNIVELPFFDKDRLIVRELTETYLTKTV